MSKRTTAARRAQRRRRKLRLFAEQKGRCFYCDCLMVIHTDEVLPHMTMRKNIATIEHLDDRWSDSRGRHPLGVERTVLACWQCNNEKGKVSQAEQPIELLRQKAMH